MCHHWTESDIAFLRENKHLLNAELAARMGLTPMQITGARQHFGATKFSVMRRAEAEPRFPELRRLHAAGYTDPDIAERLGWTRFQVAIWRQRLGLPGNAFSDRQKRKYRVRRLGACRRLGIRTLGQQRYNNERRASLYAGWPAGTTGYQRRLLEALEKSGPVTARQWGRTLGRFKVFTYTLRRLLANGSIVAVGHAARVRGTAPVVYDLSAAAKDGRRIVREDVA